MSELAQVVIPALIMGAPGIAALFIQLRRDKQERKKLQAETDQASGSAVQASGSAASSFAEAASLVAKQNTELQEKVDRLCDRVDEQDTKIKGQDDRIKTLESTVERYARRIAYLMGGIDQLIRQITGLNVNPCWTPDEWKEDDGS